MQKPNVSTVWLEGCSGCHMSFLDLDEGLAEVFGAVNLTVSPVTDFKDYQFPESTLGIVEGAVGNVEQEEITHKLRKKCHWLMAWGDCAVFGGINNMRNHIPTGQLLRAGYVETPSSVDGVIPVDPELPALLSEVLPVDRVVKVDIYVPGCPPSPESILYALREVLQDRKAALTADLIHFD